MDVGEKAKQIMSYFTEPNMMKLLRFANIAGVVYFWVVSCTALYVNLFCVLPVLLADDDFWLRFHWWLFSLAAFNMYLNYFICLRKNSVYTAAGTRTGEGDELTAKGWDHCVPCQQYIPPRAHHCPICKRCILKRDRHCYFLGVCVGHFNQRYFLVFLLYATIAALHAALSFLAYLNTNLAPFLSAGAYNYLYPIGTAMWILGYIPTYLYGTLTLAYICLMLGIGCCGLFYFHFRRALSGQTSHEYANRITTYNRGSQRNLEEVFGRYWWLAFVLPIPLKQTSDGIVWNKPKEIKGI
ncbi:palmitoyltransferase ZDHHC22-like [Acanthaster planci]|uniref:Palmitoyltransferase n=1 Tax=Acanthaster planci TaxID=133434 RepID=A0A8B7YN35_ACAPL|nr:palmitoyltransferase ZDHHC22-like [Acanthaster planci]XP_022094678.1 palmitoyltransferase ZDHHC22-like [Acanthaster planci]